ncbi:MAG: 50S ribosomal protein L25, partial [Rhodococcus sp. (in: high G+C Gram-positive bacteria)]|nr:50S ribosomal protein L25 [Rhodococcus sp. (in: high G+C Gram-positive bacteria)]MDX5454189.1 50S ribosomal protein L25 [Rhodococcus sp. (in: high G+C Gram-positive bacteria)]
PEQVEVSIDGVEAGTQILANDVQLPAGATLQGDPELLLVNVVAAPTAAAMEGESAEGEAAESEEA